MKQGTRLTFLGPLFPQQGHSVCFFKCTVQSSSTSGLCSAPGRRRWRPSRAEVLCWQLPATSCSPAPRHLPPTPQGWAQHQAPGTAHIHHLPGSHPDISALSAPPPSRELLCCAPQSWYGLSPPSSSPSPKYSSAGMGNQLFLAYTVPCSRDTITEPDVL